MHLGERAAGRLARLAGTAASVGFRVLSEEDTDRATATSCASSRSAKHIEREGRSLKCIGEFMMEPARIVSSQICGKAVSAQDVVDPEETPGAYV